MRLSEAVDTIDTFDSEPKAMRLSEAISEDKADIEGHYKLKAPFLFAPRGVVFSPDKSLEQLMEEDKVYAESPEYKAIEERYASKIRAMLEGVAPLGPEEWKISAEEHPIAKAVGQIAGLISIGKVTAGIAPMITFSKQLASLPTLARIAAGRMAQTGVTFGMKELSDNMAEILSGKSKDFQKVVTDTFTSTAFGTGLGAVGVIPQPIFRIPAEAGYGFATTMMRMFFPDQIRKEALERSGYEKAIPKEKVEITKKVDEYMKSGKYKEDILQQSSVNAAIFAIFGLFNTKNLSEAYKKAAWAGAKRSMVDRMVSKGVDIERAQVVTDRYFTFALAKNGGWAKATMKDFDTFSKAMRKGWKIIVEPGIKPEAKAIVPAVAPKTPQKGPLVPPGEAIVSEKGIIPAKPQITPESVKPDVSGITPLQKQIEAMEERQARVEIFKDALEEIDTIRQYFKRGIKKYKDEYLKEELTGIPAFYITKEGGISPDEAMDELRTKFAVEVNDEVGLKEYLQNLEQSRKNLLTDIEIYKPGFVTKRETTILADKIKAVEMGIREGRIKTKAEVKNVQDEIIQVIEDASLEAKDRAKFLRTIKNIQTKEQLQKAFPEIIERLSELKDVAERRGLINDIKDKVAPSALKTLRPEYRKPIEALISGIGLAKRTPQRIMGLKKLAEFIENEPNNQIPQKRLNELKILEETPIDKISTEQLQDINDAIAHFVKLNDLKNNLIIKGKLRQKEAVINQAISNVLARHENKPGSVSGLDSAQQIQEASYGIKIFGVDSFNAELKTEILDGKDDGIIQEVIYRAIDRGIDNELAFEHTAEDYFKEKFGDIDISGWSKVFQLKEKDIDFIEVGISKDRKIRMTKSERVALLLHSRNLKNTKHILGGGFSFAETPSKIVKIKPEDLDAIVASATPEEVKVADAISEYFNTIQKQRINEVSMDLLGHELAREEAYFPIRTNSLDRFKDDLIKAGNFPQRTLEGLGVFKERINSAEALIVEDAFVVAYKSIKQVGAYVGLGQPLRSAKALLNDNEFRKTLINNGLEHYLKSLDNYLKRIEDNSINLDNVDKLLVEFINRLDVAILGVNPYVAAKQAISYLLAGTEMDMKYLQGNYSLKVSQGILDEMAKYSPQLRDRLSGNVTRELGELASVGVVKKFFTGETVLSSKMMAWIRKMDRTAIAGIWKAVKVEVKANNPDLTGDEFYKIVANRAWEVIRRTQPTFHIKDRSTIGMNRDIMVRLLTKYSSQRNKNYMVLRRAYERYNRSNKTNADKARLIKALGLLAVVSPLMLIAIDEIRDKAYNREQKRSLFVRALNKFLSVTLSNIYFVGPVADSIISKIDKGTYAGYDVDTPLSSFVDSMSATVADFTRGLGQLATQEKYVVGVDRGKEKWKKSIGKSLVNMIDIAGQIKGIPIKNIRKMLMIPFQKPRSKKKRYW